MKHISGYSGEDSMRAKAQRLFGNAVEDVDMTSTPSRSTPSRTPMRMYAKGGSVKREGAMLPKSARGEVQGGTLTDLHLPKKMESARLKAGGKACYKKGGKVSFDGEHEDMQDMKALREMTGSRSALKSMDKGNKNSAIHPKRAQKETGKISIHADRSSDGKEIAEAYRSPKQSFPKTIKPTNKGNNGMHPAKRAMPEGFKKGGSVKGSKAKTTSTMRQAVKGRSRSDMTLKKGNDLDVGSVQEVAVPKKRSMLHPKPASNGSKNSKMNVEKMSEVNRMKRGGKC